MEIKSIDAKAYFSWKEENFRKLFKKKIGVNKYKKIKPKENLLKSGKIDSLDLADIHSFIEKKFKVKIKFTKIFGKNFEISINNIFKTLN